MNLSPCGSPLEFFDLSPVCAPKDRYGEQGLDDTSYIDVAGFRVITLKRSLYPFDYFSDSDVGMRPRVRFWLIRANQVLARIPSSTNCFNFRHLLTVCVMSSDDIMII